MYVEQHISIDTFGLSNFLLDEIISVAQTRSKTSHTTEEARIKAKFCPYNSNRKTSFGRTLSYFRNTPLGRLVHSFQRLPKLLFETKTF